jgi:hypothetical protein
MTLEIDVVAFLDVVGIECASEFKEQNRRICKDRTKKRRIKGLLKVFIYCNAENFKWFHLGLQSFEKNRHNFFKE